MDTIDDLISLLSAPDRKSFVEYLDQRNKRADVRNIELFKAYCNGNQVNLKSKIGSNAYNVLKLRLKERLIDFIAASTMYSEATQEIGVIKLLLIARKMFTYNKEVLGFKILEKAKQTATELNHYSLLGEIYHTYIEQSHRDNAPEQQQIIDQFEENQRMYLQQERLNIAYAILRKAYKGIENRAESVDLEHLIEETYAKLGISSEDGYSFQSLCQLAEIADISGAYKRDYHSVDLFFVNKLEEIQGGPGDTEKFLIYHIDLLYTIAYIHFRKKQFDKSLEFLEQMERQMERSNRKYYAERLVNLKTLKALNLNYRNEPNRASDILDNLIKSGIASDKLLQAKLARAMMHFQQGEFNSAHQILSKFQRNDSWYERHIGMEWMLQKKHIEILLHIELGNIDFVESRIASLQRKYKDILEGSKQSMVQPFLKLIQKVHANPIVATSPAFQETVERSFTWKPREEEDVFLMSFYAWLKAKMERKDIYAVTLELMR